MFLLPVIVLATLELNHRDLFAPAFTHDFCRDFPAVHEGRTDLNIVALCNQEHAVKGDRLARTRCKLFEAKDFPFLDAVLLATTFDYREHIFSEG